MRGVLKKVCGVLAASLIAVSPCGTQVSAAEGVFYTRSAEVYSVTRQGIIEFIDEDGNLWAVEDEGFQKLVDYMYYQQGEAFELVLNDNGTQDITDDEVIAATNGSTRIYR